MRYSDCYLKKKKKIFYLLAKAVIIAAKNPGNHHEKKEAIFDSWNLRVTLQKKKKVFPIAVILAQKKKNIS